MSDIPPKLAGMREMFKGMERARRIQMLIDIGETYKEVPAEIATRPYPESLQGAGLRVAGVCVGH